MSREPLHVVISLDVEEEGLFSGKYARRDVSVKNVEHLRHMEPLLKKFDLPATMLCTHHVFSDAAACRALDRLRASCRVEIGAHLHHWNTPPANGDAEAGHYVSPGKLRPELFRQRLEALFSAGLVFNGAPLLSFRMGKWDLHRWHWPFLAEAGVLVDASVRPLHFSSSGPDHFFAPADPYWVEAGGARLVEAPLTCLPWYPSLPGQVDSAARLAAGVFSAGVSAALKRSVQKWSALAMLPIYHPLWAMKAVAALHMARGGRFLILAWHSSEMMPGGAPHMPDEASVTAFISKIDAFLEWLHAKSAIKGLVLTDLAGSGLIKEAQKVDKNADWKYN